MTSEHDEKAIPNNAHHDGTRAQGSAPRSVMFSPRTKRKKCKMERRKKKEEQDRTQKRKREATAAAAAAAAAAMRRGSATKGDLEPPRELDEQRPSDTPAVPPPHSPTLGYDKKLEALPPGTLIEERAAMPLPSSEPPPQAAQEEAAASRPTSSTSTGHPHQGGTANHHDHIASNAAASAVQQPGEPTSHTNHDTSDSAPTRPTYEQLVAEVRQLKLENKAQLLEDATNKSSGAECSSAQRNMTFGETPATTMPTPREAAQRARRAKEKAEKEKLEKEEEKKKAYKSREKERLRRHYLTVTKPRRQADAAARAARQQAMGIET